MKKWGVVVLMFVALNLPWSIASVEAKMDNLARLPGATLLMGYPPYNLVVTTGDTTSKLQTGGGDWYVTPSMSADGHLIASARADANAASSLRSRPKLTVSTYSMADQRWADYKDLDVYDGSVAISPDGTKLACITRKVAGAPSHLRILDLHTGAITAGPESSDNAGPDLSWSPDRLRQGSCEIGGWEGDSVTSGHLRSEFCSRNSLEDRRWHVAFVVALGRVDCVLRLLAGSR